MWVLGMNALMQFFANLAIIFLITASVRPKTPELSQSGVFRRFSCQWLCVVLPVWVDQTVRGEVRLTPANSPKRRVSIHATAK